MPTPSLVVYIDESGDEGFAFKGERTGSSHWFVLAGVVTRKERDLDTVKLVDRVRAQFQWERKPLHFRKLKHEHRVPYIDHVAKARVRLVVVAIHKPSLAEPEKFQTRSVLYHYAARLLLERVSWCCRDHRRADDSGDGTAEIVFSNRAGTSYDELREYFRLLKSQSAVERVTIDWAVVKPDRVRAVNHDQSMGLQVADAVASAFYMGLQVNPHGFNEPRYARMLQPVVYRRRGQTLGYGLKLWPREIGALTLTDAALRWVPEVYQ